MTLLRRRTGRRNGAPRPAFLARNLRRARVPERAEQPGLPRHGADALPWGAKVDAYNAKIRAEHDSFLGDRASNRAFKAILAYWRDTLREVDYDPLGDTPNEAIRRHHIDTLLVEGDPQAAGLVHGVWRSSRSPSPMSPGGCCASRRGAARNASWWAAACARAGSASLPFAVGRASMLLTTGGQDVGLLPIRHDLDHAGPIGGAHPAPTAVLSAHEALLAVDIGGTNMRAGVVRPGLDEAPDLSAASAWDLEVWRHAGDRPEREEAVERLVAMLRRLVDRAEKRGLGLAPSVGIGCPGRIGGAAASRAAARACREIGRAVASTCPPASGRGCRGSAAGTP